METELYASKQKRDSRARELIRMGKAVKRSRVLNQQLHPMYVVDLPDGNTAAMNGDYRTFHSILYKVEWS